LTTTFYATVRPAPVIGSVVDAASFQSANGFAPGSYITIFGSALSDAVHQFPTLYLPYSLSAVSVSFYAGDGSSDWPGRLWYVSPGQINVQIPWELEGQTSAKMAVNIGSASAVVTIPIASFAPAMFESNGLAIAQDQHYGLISASNPAQRGSVIMIYANGLGAVDQPVNSGEATPPQLFNTLVKPTVTIGGQNAEVLFSGLTPYSIGLYQVNVKVPVNAPAGVQPVLISGNGVSSQAANLPLQ
jgi:uncharacterized protein (TIGR03437 family)